MRWPSLVSRATFVLLLALGGDSSRGWAQTDAAEKSAFDFDRLQSTLKGDQVDYFSGDWSYTIPLTTIQGAGDMALPLRLVYSSAVTGVDRLIRVTTASRGMHTLNNASWVGLGWNLNLGAITVTGGYNVPVAGGISTHPFSYDLSMVMPDGAYRLVRQLGADGQPSNRFFTERHTFWDIVWNDDPNTPLASTWTVRDLSGQTYTFGKIIVGSETLGANLTTKAASIPSSTGMWSPIGTEFVYQWKLAEIRDPEGNAIRFTYESDTPITTIRDTFKERDAAFLGYSNVLDPGDLDPRYATGTLYLAVVKTMWTAHLSEAKFVSASGQVVRTLVTETSPRPDLPVTRVSGTVVTYENYQTIVPDGSGLTYGYHLKLDKHSYRMLDGVDSFNKLDAVVVKDGTGAQLARYELIYDDTHPTLRPPVAPGDSVQTLLLRGVRMLGKTSADGLPAYLFTYRDADSYR
ncbi:MAG: hypothetical protein HY710_08475, partial [Candidatus Latescibacteria bacterium]|nr:hypothetical protein [Candidatus Latescibacterota bacterium]